jgi:cytochrome c-type biogenesis protein CcmH
MTVWLIFAGMTAAVMALLAQPFLRPRKAPLDQDFERVIYRDQLAEVERDQERGLIGPEEADAARNEISRRLLHTAEGRSPKTSASAKAALVSILLVPAIAIPVYLKYGNPERADVPLQERLAHAIENKDFDAMIVTVERHLAAKPDDLQGWRVLANGYREQKRWLDAANALANILRIDGQKPDTLAAYGEMLIFANEGMVTATAHKAFLDALKLDPKLPIARFFDAVALKQEGKLDEGKARLAAMLADAEANSPYRPMVEAELKSLDSAKAPMLTKEQMAQGQAMAPADQKQMIAGMIDGLEQRLGTDGKDLPGWLRLIRARQVNQQSDKAKSSLTLARNIFRDDPASLGQLRGLAEELGIQ